MLTCIPRKPALCAQAPNTVEVLVQIQPDQLPTPQNPQRKPFHLALVLDRSGSMGGEKWKLTAEAACLAVDKLEAQDYLAVVAFDDRIETVYSGFCTQPRAAKNAILALETRNSTDLYGGWSEGARLLREAQQTGRLNRMVVLTDGEANHGETRPQAIGQGVSEQARQGLQTTTLGFGADYNQDLLRRMAAAGRGNHAYIDGPERLATFFEEEMQTLLRARGTDVRLDLRPRPGVRVETLARVGRDSQGRVLLADLVQGSPLALMLRLEVEHLTQGELLDLELCWFDLDQSRLLTHSTRLALESVSAEEWSRLPSNIEVEAHLAVAQAQLRQDRAMELLQLDQEDVALQCLAAARDLKHLPDEQKRVLDDLMSTVERGDYSGSYKKAAMYGHGHGSGHARVSSHYAAEVAQERAQRQRRTLPLGDGPILYREPRPRAPWPRLEGMLRGHFFGERLVRGRGPLGEGASLTVATLNCLRRHYPHDLLPLGKALSEAPLLHPTTSMQKFRHKWSSQPFQLLDMGSPSAGCAALRRMCPFLLVHSPRRFLEVAMATALTHHDNLALTASVGYVALLESLLEQQFLPAPGFYLETFLQAIQGLENGTDYTCQRGTFQNWQGTLSAFLPLALDHARQAGLSAGRALQDWGSGPYLLELIPSVLYILEKHADNPALALQVATTNTIESDTLGMLVGAALGALHGSQPGWFLQDDLEALLDGLKT